MHIHQILQQCNPSCSFEFFPPRGPAGEEALRESLARLEGLNPAFVSVTYGAGGSTRELTHQLVVNIQSQSKLTAIPHLTCVGHSREQIDRILQRYAEAGICNVLALGGDPPASQPNYDRSQDAFRYAAELVRHIRSGPYAPTAGNLKRFGVGVACFPEGHPATPNRLLEMDHLKAKVDAGADYLCTQLFFDNHDFYDFAERCELAGIRAPILAGIMPISTKAGMARMAELSGGTRFPARLQRLVSAQSTDADVSRVGVEWATAQCEDLLNHGVRGIHFYTLNRSHATLDIFAGLRERFGRTPFAKPRHTAGEQGSSPVT